QPPLYYFFAGLVARGMQAMGHAFATALWYLQWGSFAFSIVALAAGLWAGLQVFGKKETRPFMMYAALLCTLPGIVFISSRLSNDALFAAFSFSAFAFLLRWWKNGGLIDWLIVFALLGLGFITKVNILPLIPVAGLCLLCKPGIPWSRK